MLPVLHPERAGADDRLTQQRLTISPISFLRDHYLLHQLAPLMYNTSSLSSAFLYSPRYRVSRYILYHHPPRRSARLIVFVSAVSNPQFMRFGYASIHTHPGG